jgi:hypothetical protein
MHACVPTNLDLQIMSLSFTLTRPNIKTTLHRFGSLPARDRTWSMVQRGMEGIPSLASMSSGDLLALRLHARAAVRWPVLARLLMQFRTGGTTRATSIERVLCNLVILGNVGTSHLRLTRQYRTSIRLLYS